MSNKLNGKENEGFVLPTGNNTVHGISNTYNKTQSIEEQISLFCEEYGYECMAAELEYEIPEEEDILLPMVDIEGYDGFWETFGEDAMADDEAIYRGMASALKDYTGKDWDVMCDGYRVIGISKNSNKTIDEKIAEHNKVMAENIGRVLSDAICRIIK